jgi:hypothetical protein
VSLERQDGGAAEERVPAKPKCFVIQWFDGATFDRRYRESFKPALDRAGAAPQRADEILGLSPVIEKIQDAIEAAQLCLAEVSVDNPNVWLELGYALALKRRVVIVCDRALREKLPFDVQHRPVIFYRSDSPSGFKELESSLEKWVRNEIDELKRQEAVPVLVVGSQASQSLTNPEATLLTILLMERTRQSETSSWSVEEKMQARGIDDFETALALVALVRAGYVSVRVSFERSSYGDEEVKWYSLTDQGEAWLVEHKGDLKASAPVAQPAAVRQYPVREAQAAFSDDDDIPF